MIDKIKAVISAKTPFRQDRKNTVPLILAVVTLIIHWVVLLSNIQPGNEKILLQFDVVIGTQLVAQSFFLYFIPSVALIFYVLDTYLARQFYEREKSATYSLNFFSILIQMIFFVATVILIIANA